MNLEYVPILRNLKAERDAITYLSLSDKIIPLIEIILEKPQINSKESFLSFNKKYFNQIPNYFFVDIPMYINITRKTKSSYKNFLLPIYNNQLIRTGLLINLSSLAPEKMIPVVSYNPNSSYIKNLIIDQANILRASFKKVAFRIFDSCTDKIIKELEKIITSDDIVLLDIRNKNHTDRSLYGLYSKINNIKVLHGCKTVILHQALPTKIKNTRLIDNHVIPEAITDLITSYDINYNFDGFGDFAGIKAQSLEEIPVSSPAYIHYCNSSNAYIGFKGIFKKTSTFESLVLPKYTSSKYWSSLTDKHKASCHGCQLIQGMLNGSVKANYAPRWKTLTICHYIKSVDEIL